MSCYACDQTAINACKRCAKPYCGDHGNAVYCGDCLKPASALPSFNLYRGALLALLVGTMVAIVLLVRPPGETKGESPVIVGKTSPTATASNRTAEATIAAETPQVTATPSSPAGTATSAATTTPTESAFTEYTVQSGDNLYSIATQYAPAGTDVTSYVRAIIAQNGLSGTDAILNVGQKLLLPKHS